jgi:hypothetical protein
MTRVLHILNQPPDDFVRDLIARQQSLPDTQVRVIDLTSTTPDYPELVRAVFEADSVASW